MYLHISWFFILLISVAESSKIMMAPGDHKSHALIFAILGERLAKEGHEVHILTSTKHLLVLNNFERVHQNFVFDVKSNLSSETTFSVYLEDTSFNVFTYMDMWRLYKHHMTSFVRQVINPEETLWKKLQAASFDLFIIDGWDKYRALYVIPYLLKVPYISLSTYPLPWKSGVPVFPSEPYFPLSILSENSSIIDRIKNLLAYVIVDRILELMQPSFLELMDGLYPNEKDVNLDTLYQASEMIFVDQQVICLDFQRIEMPHYRYTQGLAAQEPRPLSDTFKEIADSAVHGLVIISFGSAIPVLPDSLLEKIVFAAEQLSNIPFIMRHNGEEDFPSNLHVFKWIPQNDLLAHPNSKVFVTHGGNNGQVEAINHGVPQLVVPIYFDQFYNGWRAEKKGFGITFYRWKESKEVFLSSIKTLLYDSKYVEKAKKCSSIVKSLPSGQDQIAFWVNHVLKFGGDHLKPFSIKLPLYKQLMLDVFLFIAITFILISVLCFKCCSKLCRKRQLIVHPKTD